MTENTDSKEVFRPTSLDDFVGQTALKAKLNVYIRESLAAERPLPHMLLTSSPGCGKTTLAHMIADAVGDPIQVVDLSKLRPNALPSLIRRFEGGILFFDEVHKASSKQQDECLTLMEEGYVATPGGGRVECDWLTIIAATTEPEKLVPAFKARFSVRPEFAEYNEGEMAQIVRDMAERADIDLPDDMAMALGSASANTPRQARDLVMAYRALTHGGTPTVEQVLDLCDVDAEGLTTLHLEYLRVLERMDGTAGASVLAKMMRVHPSVLAELERLLFHRDLVVFTPSGRALTPKGDRKLRGKPASVGPRRRPVSA